MNLINIIKYSAKPPTIFYPLPIVPLLIVGFARGDIYDAIFVVAFTSLFYSALNLWNHVNDYKEDFKAGKDTPFIHEKVRKITTLYVFFAYVLAAVIYTLSSHTHYGKLAFFTVLILTFLYSDNVVTKLRLKKHYVTELLTYFICIPLFISSLYDLVSPIDSTGAFLALVLLPFLISTVFIKDLKDITEDKEAGWKTLGVVFEAENLVKLFFYSNVVFYLLFSLFLLQFSKVLSSFSLIFLIVPLDYTVKSKLDCWEVNQELAKRVQLTVYLGFIFIIFIIFIILFYFK